MGHFPLWKGFIKTHTYTISLLHPYQALISVDIFQLLMGVRNSKMKHHNVKNDNKCLACFCLTLPWAGTSLDDVFYCIAVFLFVQERYMLPSVIIYCGLKFQWFTCYWAGPLSGRSVSIQTRFVRRRYLTLTTIRDHWIICFLSHRDLRCSQPNLVCCETRCCRETCWHNNPYIETCLVIDCNSEGMHSGHSCYFDFIKGPVMTLTMQRCWPLGSLGQWAGFFNLTLLNMSLSKHI